MKTTTERGRQTETGANKQTKDGYLVNYKATSIARGNLGTRQKQTETDIVRKGARKGKKNRQRHRE